MADPNISPAWIVAGFFCLVGGIMFLAWRAEKKRREALVTVAHDLGLGFEPKPQEAVGLNLPDLGLFRKGGSRRAGNLMRGPMGDADGMLFDYQYTTGSGKNRSTHRQTVAAFRIPGARLPGFRCEPEHFFHRIGEALGFHDIDFDAYPVFSKKYRLNGEDESAVRALFGDTIVRLLEAKVEEHWSLEGAGDWLVIYRAGHRAKPEDWPQFLLDATQVLNAMTLERSNRS